MAIHAHMSATLANQSVHQTLVRDAGDAGKALGTSGAAIVTVLESCASAGIIDYTDSTVRQMRKAYAESAVATGTTRNNGLGAFARAWDKVAATGKLQPRPRRNTGRNAGKPRKAGNEAAINAAAEKATRETQAEMERTHKQNIKEVRRAAVAEFAAKFLSLVTLGEAIDATKAAAPSIRAGKVDASVKDLAHANKMLANMIGAAMEAAGIDVKAAILARKAPGNTAAKK